MSPLGAIHLAAAILALLSGAAVLLFRGKGNRRHRRLGWTYTGSMLTTNLTALMIYRLFGGIGPFHVAALISLVSVVLGVSAARIAGDVRRKGAIWERPKWVERHYYWMTWSYVGLAAAFASEIITRHPAVRPSLSDRSSFALAVGTATLVIVVAGASWINRARRASLKPFRP